MRFHRKPPISHITSIDPSHSSGSPTQAIASNTPNGWVPLPSAFCGQQFVRDASVIRVSRALCSRRCAPLQVFDRFFEFSRLSRCRGWAFFDAHRQIRIGAVFASFSDDFQRRIKVRFCAFRMCFFGGIFEILFCFMLIFLGLYLNSFDFMIVQYRKFVLKVIMGVLNVNCSRFRFRGFFFIHENPY